MPKNSDSGSWGIWVGAAVLIAAALGLVVLMAGNGGQKPPAATITGSLTAEDHVQGDPNAKVVLLEYGDFQCPACAAYDPLVEQIAAEFGNKIAYAYRYFPLRTIHANADLSSQAAEAAGRQGKFWEMVRVLYAKQRDWAEKSNSAARDIFAGYAKDLGLDTTKFLADMADPAVMERINKDVASGTAANLQGTPTFFLNGVQITPQNADQFRTLVQAAVNAAGQ